MDSFRYKTCFYSVFIHEDKSVFKIIIKYLVSIFIAGQGIQGILNKDSTHIVKNKLFTYFKVWEILD